jgi:type II secretory pathway pseudopilin PulG
VSLRLRVAGFSLIEVIVSMTIIIIMAAVILPSIIRAVDQARVDGAVDELVKIYTAIFAFRTATDESPRRMSQLVLPITTAQRNICNGPYTGNGGGTDVAEWVAGPPPGPFYDKLVPAAGLPIGIGLLQDSFPRSGTNPYWVNVRIFNVSLDDATQLDLRNDDGVWNTGNIIWSAAATDPVNLTVLIPGAC